MQETSISLFVFIIERKKSKKIDADTSDDNDAEEKSSKEEFEYDIMISYCHADKEVVHKIHRYLADRGFKIWIDKEQIYGPGKHSLSSCVSILSRIFL